MDQLATVVPERVVGVYLVGGLALGDFSERLSNLDVVVVAEPALEANELAAVAKAERYLDRPGRPAAVWYCSWEQLARPAERSTCSLDTPMTRALLCEDALALFGPDWPVVDLDEHQLRSWCASRLQAVAGRAQGLMLLRPEVTDVVLEACRLALGAIEGRVYSKSEAAEAVAPLVRSHFRRILKDASGFRQGGRTSMYWGPFERKYDARALMAELREAVEDSLRRPASPSQRGA